MDTNIGTAQTSLTLTSNATTSIQRYYFTRFVSEQLSTITSITAQTWTYNFSTSSTAAGGRFPVNGNGQPVRVMAYVWRPGTGKVGDIADGNSAATIYASTSQRALIATFTGSLVSGVQDGDVICFEVWFEITQSVASALSDSFFFDGTTVTTTANASVTNHASFIETPQSLTFAAGLTRVSLSQTYNYNILARISQSRVYKYNILQRVAASQTYKYDILARISLGRIYRYIINTPVRETTSHFQSPSRTHSILPFLTTGPKSLSIEEAPITISASLERQKFVSRSTDENIIVISEFVDPVKILVRNLAQSVGIFDDLTRISIKAKSLTQTVTTGDALTQTHIVFKNLAQTVSIFEAITSLRTKTRSLAQTITIGETLSRIMVKLRSFISVEVITITGIAVAGKFKSKALAETVTVGDTLSRLSLKIKALAQSITLGATLARSSIKSRAPGFPEAITIGESLTKAKKTIRGLTDTITIGETLTRALTKSRTLTQTIMIAASPVIGKFKTIFINEIPVIVTEQAIPDFIKKVTRNLATQTIAIGESLTKTKKSVRSLAQTITISDAVTEAQIFFRDLAQTITIGDSLTRIKSRFLSLTQTIAISDLLTRARLRVKNIAQSLSISDALSLGKVKGLLILDSITIGDFASVVRLISGAPRWLLAGQVSDFPDSIENLVKAYVNSKWSIETPSMGLNPASQVQTDNFAYDGARTYYMKIKEIASNVMTRRIRLNTYEFETPIEFELYSRRLSKGEAFLELNAMINELLRIFGTYQHEAIFGIQGITFDRITQIERERSAAQTVWARRLTLTLHYYKVSTTG